MSLLPSHHETAQAAAIELLAIKLFEQNENWHYPAGSRRRRWVDIHASHRDEHRRLAVALITQEYPE